MQAILNFEERTRVLGDFEMTKTRSKFVVGGRIHTKFAEGH
jgi:hypothetical protein